MKEISIVIPVYNESKNILVIYSRLKDLLNNSGYPWEIIFVNDGSNDDSGTILADLASKDNNVKLISFTRNFGQQAALTAGMDFADGEAVITMDCDLQDPPELITEMISEWKKGSRIVFARRKIRNDRFLKKYTAILYYKLLYKLAEIKIPGNIGEFRLIDRFVLDQLKNMREKSRYLRGMVAWLGFDYTIVDYERPNRIYGKTGFNFLKMMRLAMSGFLSFSLIPLRLGFLIGIISIFLGTGFLFYIIYDILINSQVYPLYKWLSIALFIFVGFLFILVWVLGEYIGRIYDESKGRPIYVIKEKKNVD
jgi:polyisoprenyl-phosphate glycosyltransferase